MVAILSRIFEYTGPQLNFFSLLGLGIMILGGLVCIFSAPITQKLLKKETDGEQELPTKTAGLVIVVLGLIITMFVK